MEIWCSYYKSIANTISKKLSVSFILQQESLNKVQHTKSDENQNGI